MLTSSTLSRLTRLLLTVCCLTIVGCVDSIPTVLRDRLALATENVDLIMHVVDQESAKEYNKVWVTRKEKRLAELDERQRKVEDNLDKKDYKDWLAYKQYITERIAKKEEPKKNEPDPPLPKFYFYYARECVACELAMNREAARLAKVAADLQGRGAEAGEVLSVLGSLKGAVKK